MDLNRIRRFTYSVNTVILLLVIGLAGFFYLCKATILLWFSIPTLLVYVIGYVIIAKDRLDVYVRLVYFWITLYMCLCTYCLGYKIGFHLYCMSMIPIIFYTEYMADKLGRKKINAFVVSGIIAICYLISAFNSVIVLAFLVFYSRLMLSLIGDYEKKLRQTAQIDKLTGLYNRHYMSGKLETSMSEGKPQFITMVDIDDFKKINDRYGHNAGDYVLVNVARIMREVCSGSIVSRWGGEEFLILTYGSLEEGLPVIEKFRQRVESEDFIFGEQHIKVTVTAGAFAYTAGITADKWISAADDNLYKGKKSGKNKVVS